MGWRRGLQEGCLGGPRGVLHHPGEAGDGEAFVGGVKVSGVRSRPPGHQGREGFPPRDAGSDIGRRHEEEEAVEARWNCPHCHQSRMQSVILYKVSSISLHFLRFHSLELNT